MSCDRIYSTGLFIDGAGTAFKGGPGPESIDLHWKAILCYCSQGSSVNRGSSTPCLYRSMSMGSKPASSVYTTGIPETIYSGDVRHGWNNGWVIENVPVVGDATVPIKRFQLRIQKYVNSQWLAVLWTAKHGFLQCTCYESSLVHRSHMPVFRSRILATDNEVRPRKTCI